METYSQDKVDQWRAYFELKRQYEEEAAAELERKLNRKK